MATTKIWKIEKRLDHVLTYTSNVEKTFNKNYGTQSSIPYSDLHNVLDYATDEYKTEKQYFVSGINCFPEDAYNQMMITKKNKNTLKNKILAYHGYQSFKSGEVTPEIAHEIGVKLAEELWGDRFEVVVSTHLNTNCCHNHFVINSVSFVDGKMFYNNFKTYSMMRHLSDSLCDEYGLSVLKEKKCGKYNVNYNDVYQKYARANSYQNTAKKDLDFAIAQAYSFEDFKNIMKEMEYEIIFRYDKISIKGKNYKRNIRIERAFGEDYSIDNIKRRILEEQATRIPFISAYKIKGPNFFYKGEYVKSKKKPNGLENMFRHYSFLLKVSPVKTKNNYLSAKVRADVKQMHLYTEEADFLYNNKIKTKKELLDYKEKIKTKLNELLSSREGLWKARKLEKNETNIKDYTEKISGINDEISVIRKEMMMVEDIQTRIPKVEENIQEINEKKKERGKEKNKNERIK